FEEVEYHHSWSYMIGELEALARANLLLAPRSHQAGYERARARLAARRAALDQRPQADVLAEAPDLELVVNGLVGCRAQQLHGAYLVERGCSGGCHGRQQVRDLFEQNAQFG